VYLLVLFNYCLQIRGH